MPFEEYTTFDILVSHDADTSFISTAHFGCGAAKNDGSQRCPFFDGAPRTHSVLAVAAFEGALRG